MASLHWIQPVKRVLVTQMTPEQRKSLKVLKAASEMLMSSGVDDKKVIDAKGKEKAIESTYQATPGQTLSCSVCQVKFEDVDELRGHHKLDWHRFNLKLKMKGRLGITEEEFEEIATDLSSISGSESEDEGEGKEGEDRLNSICNSLETVNIADSNEESDAMYKFNRNSANLYLYNGAGETFSVLRSVIAERSKSGNARRRSEVTDDNVEALLDNMVNSISSEEKFWAVFLCNSGHFAAGIFQQGKLIDSKTFHRYTVRKKRGTAQSAHDASGAKAKSAGATLRRYNEQALKDNIRDLMAKWKDRLGACSHVFVHAPSSNADLVFSSTAKDGLLNRNDERLRNVSLPCRRPTVKELERVYSCLITASFYNTDEVQEALNSYVKLVRGREARSPTPVSLSELSPIRKQSKETDEIDKGLKEEDNGLLKCIKKQNLNELKCILKDVVDINELLPFGKTEATTLHMAAQLGRPNFVKYLLEIGADPTIRDSRERTPYKLASQKESRDEFRRYMGTNPDAWDYSKSDIPSSLTEEMESAKLEKQQAREAKLKEKKKRDKERQKAKKKLRKQEEEKKKAEEPPQLSARELRALAAERRMQAAHRTIF
eukprot:Nk52_evm55s1992 gene=Nk52_evmTU55s1992